MKPSMIIPMPQKCEYGGKGFDIAKLKNLVVDKRLVGCERLVRAQLEAGLKVKLGDKSDLALTISYDKSVAKEGYTLQTREDGVEIKASDVSGAIYAVQTLRMATMLGAKSENTLLPGLKISDYPRFGWRGISIDEARHFFGEAEVKKIIDLMCLHKLNVLHWHLTDDQGWRIEIKKYPLLTEIGSKRDKTQINGWRCKDIDNTPHSGFYTQEQIKDIVAYAKERGVDIVPEIDMPAHLAAAMAAYPWLGCRDIERPVHYYFGGYIPSSQGIKDWNRSACVGSPKTMEFIRSVIDEVLDLFPFGYFHIGGDEVPMEEWKNCPKCNAKMKEMGYTSYKQLHTWFINEVGKYVASKGAKLIGWNEILSGGNLDNDVLVQYWTMQPDARVKKHVRGGGKVILSKHQYFYFDMPYSQYPLKNTYRFKPWFGGLKPSDKDNIVGIEGEHWSEWIDSPKKLEFQMNPRLAALSELAWTDTDDRDYKQFVARLYEYFPMLDSLGVYYAKEQTFAPKWYKRAGITRTWYGGDMNVEFTPDQKL